MWAQTDVIPSGKFILGTMKDGLWLDPFGTLQSDEILTAVRAYASGWSPISLDIEHGLFGVGGHVYVYGRAESDIPSMSVNSQIRAAFDSFMVIASSDFTVETSDTLSDPPSKKNEWAGTLQLIAIAVIAVAVVYGIRQIKEISE